MTDGFGTENAASLDRSQSNLLQYLPAVYQETPFLGKFLLAFEKVLLGRGDGGETPLRGLEEIIDELPAIFDPDRTPDAFLSWLAGWVALELPEDLDVGKRRYLIANIVPFYRRRGTRKNLEELLELFTDGVATVTEDEPPEFQVGLVSIIGVNTYIGGGPPHLFRVSLTLPEPASQDPIALARERRKGERIARAVIELEKPAHTDCALTVAFAGTESASRPSPDRDPSDARARHSRKGEGGRRRSGGRG